MKCLIYCPQENPPWLKTLLPRPYPLALKIAGKSLLEYLIDFCRLAGIKEIRLAHQSYMLENEFGKGEKWGVQLSYLPVKDGEPLDRLLRKNFSFCQNSEIIIFYGFAFFHYQKEKFCLDNYFPENSLLSGENYVAGRLSFTSLPPDLEKTVYRKASLSVSGLNSLSDYFLLSQRLLNWEINNYYLPGFAANFGLYLGRSVKIGEGSTLVPPLVLGDEAIIGQKAVVGPNVIVGKGAYIGKNSLLKNAVIGENTYTGEDMEFIDKIVYGGRVINPVTNTILDIEDDFMTGFINPLEVTKPVKALFFYLNYIFLFVLLLPGYFCYLFFRILAKAELHDHQFYLNKALRRETIPLPEGKTLFAKKVLYKTSADKFFLLKRALHFRLTLCGNFLRPAVHRYRQDIIFLSRYRPGVFSFADVYDETTTQVAYHINEELFIANLSWVSVFFFPLKVVWRRIREKNLTLFV